MRGNQLWTKAEEARLSAEWAGGRCDLYGLSQDLGRSTSAVETKARNLGLPTYKVGRTWTPERDAVLRREYRSAGATALAKVFGITPRAVIGRANRLGLSRRVPRRDPALARREERS